MEDFLNKKEIVYYFVKEIHDSVFNGNSKAEFKEKDIGPGRSLAFFVELTGKNYIEEYFTVEEDIEDIYLEATYETGKVLYYPSEKIDKLFRLYNLAKKNKKYPILGKILSNVVNPTISKVNALRIFIIEHI